MVHKIPGMPSFALLPAIIAVAAFLAGCATAPAPVGAQPEAGKGNVLVRVSVEGLKHVNSFALKARPAGGKESVSFQGWSAGSDGYWTTYYEEGEKGEFVAASLPAGEYEFHNFSALTGAWGGLRTVQAQRDFSYRFRVNAGESVYLGNLHVRFSGDTGAIVGSAGVVQLDGGRTIPFTLNVRDTRARDFPETGRLVPGLAPASLQIRLLK